MTFDRIHGFGIGYYRSFCNIERFTLGAKSSLIIGPNNCGKSNVLQFMHTVINGIISEGRKNEGRSQFKEMDKHKFSKDSETLFSLPIKKERAPEIFHVLFSTIGTNPELIERTLSLGVFWDENDDENYWIDYITNGNSISFKIQPIAHEDYKICVSTIKPWEWSQIFNSRGRLSNDQLTDALNKLSRDLRKIALERFKPMPAELICSNRKIGQDEPKETSYPFKKLPELLRDLQNPEPIDRTNKQEKFNRINLFIKSLLADEDLTLEISAGGTIQIIQKGFPLPIENLGSGIEQIIMIAAKCVLAEPSLILIEEPETNIHPSLQRQLIRFLTKNTENQYIIATHSAHLLDASDSEVIEVSKNGHSSKLHQVKRIQDKLDVCDRLGYRPSDLFQANCILWVEGPSDRTYLNHWIGIKNLDRRGQELIEGVHYSIMFYGGRMIANVEAKFFDNEEASNDLVNLRCINPWMAVIIDSDKSKEDNAILKSKEKIKSALNDNRALCWITTCREIENYIPIALLRECTTQIHPESQYSAASGKFGVRTKIGSGKNKRSFNKNKVAALVCSKLNEIPNEFDLIERLDELMVFIERAYRENRGEVTYTESASF